VQIEIGTVFEDTFLFSDTIRNNIAFGRPDAGEDEIVAAAAKRPTSSSEYVRMQNAAR
jgi:ATP-binding cassette subfamily B protein